MSGFYRQVSPATVEFLGAKPKVLVSTSALERMWHIVDLSAHEVGWLGTVRRMGPNFLIEEVFLFEQEVSATTTEISPDGLAAVATEIISSREDGMEVVNALRFWGHSHVHMAVSPSAQDEAQMSLFRENGCDFYIRGIFNKKGEVRFDIFLFSAGLVIRQAEWEEYRPADPGLREAIRAELAEKVSVIQPISVGFAGTSQPVVRCRKGGKKW